MPTTTYVNATMAANAIGARTDSTGAAVTDLSAEEARLFASMFTEGLIKPTNAFVVAQNTTPNMGVTVGSGAAKADHYVVAGDAAGQGNYLVRLDTTTVAVTIAAADASQARVDEIYLVIRDNSYDVSARGLPQIGYRQGDAGGANPGPDAAWKASALLARITVPAAATSIVTANISDQRAQSQFAAVGMGDGRYVTRSTVTTKGDLLGASGASTLARVPVGANGTLLRADSAAASGVTWSDIGVPQMHYLAVNQDLTTTSTPIAGGSDEFKVDTVANAVYTVEAFLPYNFGELIVGWGAPGLTSTIFAFIQGGTGGTSEYRGTAVGNFAWTFESAASAPKIALVSGTIIVGSAGGATGLQAYRSAAGSCRIMPGAWARFTRIK